MAQLGPRQIGPTYNTGLSLGHKLEESLTKSMKHIKIKSALFIINQNIFMQLQQIFDKENNTQFSLYVKNLNIFVSELSRIENMRDLIPKLQYETQTYLRAWMTAKMTIAKKDLESNIENDFGVNTNELLGMVSTLCGNRK